MLSTSNETRGETAMLFRPHRHWRLVSFLTAFTVGIMLTSCGGGAEPFTGIVEEPSVRAARLCGLDRNNTTHEIRAVADPGPAMVGYNIFIDDPDQGFEFSRDEEYRDLVDMRADPQLFPEKIVCLIGSSSTETLACGEYELGEFDNEGNSQPTGVMVELAIEGLDIAATVYDLETEELIVEEQLTFLQDRCPESGVFSPDGAGQAALASELGGSDLDTMIEDLLGATDG